MSSLLSEQLVQILDGKLNPQANWTLTAIIIRNTNLDRLIYVWCTNHVVLKQLRNFKSKAYVEIREFDINYWKKSQATRKNITETKQKTLQNIQNNERLYIDDEQKMESYTSHVGPIILNTKDPQSRKTAKTYCKYWWLAYLRTVKLCC